MSTTAHAFNAGFLGRSAIVAAGLTAVLVLGAPGALAPAAVAADAAGQTASGSGMLAAHGSGLTIAGIGGEEAAPIASAADEGVLLATYSNADQGFSLLVDASLFTVTEGEGAGATFTLASDPSSHLAVSYLPDWEGTPDVGEYLEEQLWHGQMEHGDTYAQVSADGGEIIYLANVACAACAYGYVDATTGQNMTVIRAIEPRSDGSAVLWSLVTSDESAETCATALVEASATFRVGADAYAGSNMWCAPADLQARPAGSTYSLLDDAGSSAAAAPADASPAQASEPARSDASAAQTPAPSQAATTALSSAYQLITYDGGYFTVTLPQGWTVQAAGEGSGFSLEAYDPADPNVRIVYYGSLVFNLNEQTREMYALGAMEGGELGAMNALYAALPVLDPCTVANAVSLLPAYSQFALDNGAVDDGTGLLVASADVTSSTPVSYLSAFPGMAAYVQDDALVSANLTLANGTACRADFLGSAITVGYGGFGMAGAEALWGVVAPTEAYDDVVAQLAPCVGTLAFSQDYVQQCNAANDALTAAALGRSAANNAVMDQVMQDFDDYIMDRDRFTFSDGSQLVIEH